MEKQTRIEKVFASTILSVLAFIFVAQTSISAAALTSDNVLNDVNAARIQNGVPILKKNNLLTIAAQRKADDMVKYGYWAHVNPQTGATPWNFILGTGYRTRYLGENLGKDFNDTIPLVSAWTASPTHRQNMLSTKFQETGIAVISAQGKTIIVQEFGGK